jgi:hypothetical protein
VEDRRPRTDLFEAGSRKEGGGEEEDDEEEELDEEEEEEDEEEGEEEEEDEEEEGETMERDVCVVGAKEEGAARAPRLGSQNWLAKTLRLLYIMIA